MKRKILFIVFDGLGDRPVEQLENKTPLESAYSPHLDALASSAINGLNHTVDRGVRPGSDVSHLSLFGYDPKKYYTGRGIFEAAGIEMDLKQGDVAFRANAGTVDENGVIVDRRAGRVDDVSAFTESIDGMEINGVQVFVKAGVGHRIGVVLRGKGLSHNVSDVDPHRPDEPLLTSKPTDKSEAAKKTAEVVNILVSKAHTIFAQNPINETRTKDGKPAVNALLLRGAGILTPIPSFQEKYGLKSCCVAGGGLYKGIASLLGMDVIKVEGATGKPNTNIANKVAAAMSAFETYDFVFLHLKGTDSCAEDGNYEGKKEYIERADSTFKPVFEHVQKNKGIVVVTSDHSTSSRLQAHTADPVPVLIAGADVRIDSISRFSERSAAQGGLGHIRGLEIMRFLMDLEGFEPLYGN